MSKLKITRRGKIALLLPILLALLAAYGLASTAEVNAANATEAPAGSMHVEARGVSQARAGAVEAALHLRKHDPKCTAPSATEDGYQYNGTGHECYWASRMGVGPGKPGYNQYIVYTIPAHKAA